MQRKLLFRYESTKSNRVPAPPLQIEAWHGANPKDPPLRRAALSNDHEGEEAPTSETSLMMLHPCEDVHFCHP